MRISLTALTPNGAHDVVVTGDDGTTVGVLAEALVERLTGHAQHVPMPQYGQGPVPVVPQQRPGAAGYPQRPPVELWVNGRRLDPAAPVTRVLSDERVNILSATVTTTRDRVAVSRFSFEMADPKHLKHLLAAVRKVDGVFDAYRVTSGV